MLGITHIPEYSIFDTIKCDIKTATVTIDLSGFVKASKFTEIVGTNI
jgi:hypothetical protein